MFAIRQIMVILVTAFVFWAGEGIANTWQLVRVDISSSTAAETLLMLNLDIANEYINHSAYVVVNEGELEKLRDAGFRFTVINEDLLETFHRNIGSSRQMGDYYTYDEMTTVLDSLAATYPEITSLTSIGQSREGREIWAMKISDFPDEEDDLEPEVLYDGCHHAREIMSPMVIIHMIEHLLENYGSDERITWIVDHRELWFVPIVNPDGYVIVENEYPLWRKNARDNNDNGEHDFPGDGVDLNRNYSYMFAYDHIGSSGNPSSQVYRGPSAFSEPETEAIRQLTINHQFAANLSYHSFGNIYLHPYGYNSEPPEEEVIYNELSRQMAFSTGYPYGSDLLYLSNGTTRDYMYGEQEEKNRVFGYTVEVGDRNGDYEHDGFFPPDELIPVFTEPHLEPCLYLAEVADLLSSDNANQVLPPPTPTITPTDTIRQDVYTISWSIDDDDDNPAILYQLNELHSPTTIVDDAENRQTRWWQFDNFAMSPGRSVSGNLSYYSGSFWGLESKLTSALPLYVENEEMIITFQTWYDFGPNDYAYFEVSTDGGNTFTSIRGSITGRTPPYAIYRSSEGWVLAEFPLDDFVGNEVYFRFRCDVSNNDAYHEGWYIDDISPVPVYAVDSVLSTTIADTQYTIYGRPNGVYYYTVRAKDDDGQWGAWSSLETTIVQSETGAPIPTKQINIPTITHLYPPYPNPFNPQTSIRFDLPQSTNITLQIYHMTGGLIKTIYHHQWFEEGRHQVQWGGRNYKGEMVSSGIYVINLVVDNKAYIEKIVLLK